MRKKTKSRLVNVVFVVICSLVCAKSLQLFWDDLNHTSVRSDKNELAVISFKHNVAQRKFDDRVVWERLQKNSTLYEQDTIRTSRASQAIISFKNGQSVEINMDENTMIQICRTKDGAIGLSVGSGNITVDTTGQSVAKAEVAVAEKPSILPFIKKKTAEEKQPAVTPPQSPETPEKTAVTPVAAAPAVVISMADGTNLNIEKGSRITAEVDKSSGQNNFQLEAGNASVEDVSGKIEKVEEGQAVQVEKGGKIQKRTITVTGVSRELDLIRFSGEEKKNVEVAWKTSDGLSDTPVKIETSFDKNFSKIEKTWNRVGSGSVTIENGGGKLFWRVYPEDNPENVITGRFNVINIDRLKTSGPVDNSIFKYRRETPKITFKWQGNSYADRYLLEVFSSEDSQVPVIEYTTQNQTFTTGALTAGEYYWRVTPYYSFNNLGWVSGSDTKQLTVIRQEKVNPPLLTSPQDNAKFMLTDKGLSVSFNWKSDVKDASYRVVLAQDSEFAQKPVSIFTKNLRVTTEESNVALKPGKYYWKVERTSDEDEEDTFASAVRNFTVEKYVPEFNKLLYPPANFVTETSQISNLDFVWKISRDFAPAEYEGVIQLSKTKDFNSILLEKQKKESKHAFDSLAAGVYWWRAGAKNIATGEVKGLTEVRRFEVKAPLSAPAITYPRAGTTNLIYGSDSINVRWTPVVDADYYKVEVYDEDGNRIPQPSDTVVKSTFAARLGSDHGKFSVKVQALCKESDTSVARNSGFAEISFSVRQPVMPRLLSPAPGARLEGLYVLRGGVTLYWKKGDEAVSSQLTIKRLLSDGSWKVERVIADPKESEKIGNLPSGTYSWSINGTTKGGIPLTSENAQFTVTAIPELNKPVLSEPASGLVIDRKYLKKNRSITFDWNDVTDATDYTFILYLRGADGSLTKLLEEKVTESEYKLKNLKQLEVGEFEWRVIARSHGKDGIEEQRSRAAVSRFRIFFELPKRVQAVDTGVQYGE